MVFSSLINSSICRLCAEENENGCFLYSKNENEQNLSELINTYLPVKLSNDGVLPQTICPGCNIQLEATMEFINLIIKGQKVLRELIQMDKEKLGNTKEAEQGATELLVCEINPEFVYPQKHPIVLQAQGVDKPKRKRGRPKKVKPVDEPLDEVQPPPEDVDPFKEIEISGKRKRKTPSRFKEAVQGKELERIFIQEGMIDEEEPEEEEAKPPVVVPKPGPGEVIGHSEVSGELIVMVKGKGRGRPRGGRVRSNKEICVICGMEFTCLGRYMCHVAQHGRVQYRCATCGETNETRLAHEQHQSELQHEGLEVIHMDLELQPEEVTEPENISQALAIAEADPQSIPGISLPTIDLDISEPIAEQPAEMVTMEQPSMNNENKEILFEEINTVGEEIVSNDVTEEADDIQEISEEYTSEKPKNEPKEKTKPKGVNRLQCNHCDKVFSNKQAKSIHMKARHAGERPYVCRVCGASYPYPRSLTLHMLTHKRNDSSAGYACDLCGKVLSHPSSVVYHKESEHGGQSYVCGKCGKAFKHKQLLQRHQLVHSQTRPYHCKECEASFKTKANLLNHQSLHSGIKKFSCALCKQKFAHKTSLTLHMRWHTGDKPYVCSECNKGFTQKGNLAEHMRIHTGEKPYTCELCLRTFTTSSQHKLHMRRHTGERPFPCQHCGKQFPSRESWRGHMRREVGARRHRCECGRTFAERAALAKHARAHTGERPFRCAHCPRTFADRSNRNKHMRQMHKMQMSLLAASPSPPPPGGVAGTDELEERVIFVTYDMNAEHNPLHILDPEQEETLKCIESDDALTSVYAGASMLPTSPRAPSPALYYDDENQHITVTDEEGNPVHFTMQDGTQLAITSLDGKSLQVITQEGQTIPVEINQFTNEEEVQCTDEIPELSLTKSLEEDVPTVAQYFSIV